MNPSVSPVKAGSNRHLAVLLSLLLAGLTLLVFWPVTRCDFVNFDDPDYVTANPQVQSGLTLANLAWAATTGAASNWHPLTWLSLMLDASLFGTKPAGFHFTNLAIHAANAVLLFWLLRALTAATWRSALVAAFFAWHPLAVESVAWISERKNVLSTCFGLLSLLFYTRYAQAKSPVPHPQSPVRPGAAGWFYVLSLLAFTLGLLSKPMLVTWPFLLLVLDYWPLQRWQPGRWLALVVEKNPFLAVAVAVSVVTVLVQRLGRTVVAVNQLPLDARGGNAVISYVRYLGKLAWPVDLAVFYPHPGHWPLASVLLAVTVLGGITLLAWVTRRRQPYLLTGWLWYVGTLVPVIGLVQVGGQAIADRYTYIPGVGLLVMVVWGAFALTRRGRGWSLLLALADVAALVVCIGLTRQQISYWQNSETLFRRALAVTDNNWMAHYNLGEALDRLGRTDAAMHQYELAFQCQPNYAEPRNNLGVDLVKAGQTEAAISQYLQAIRSQPDYADAWNNLGVALAREDHTDEAISDYEQALRLNPAEPEVHKNLGEAMDKQGRINAAISYYQSAVQLNPQDAQAFNNLGVDYARQGRSTEAAEQFQHALQVQPDYAEAGSNLGYLWALQDEHLDQALTLIQRAHQVDPKNSGTLDNLGWVLFKLNRPAEGLDYARQAIQYAPRPDAEIYEHLGDIYAALHQRDQAVAAWRQSLAISPSPDVQKKLDRLGGP